MTASSREPSAGKRTRTAAKSTRKGTSASATSSRKRSGSRRGVAAQRRINGQRSIDDSRATQIQTALIRSGYLSGTPSGHWDDQTEAAMQKYQADNGWQTRLMPDSRAIIKLGLGPESAETAAAGAAPAAVNTSSPSPATQP